MFDVKHDRGGMVDVEFIVQFLVLRTRTSTLTWSQCRQYRVAAYGRTVAVDRPVPGARGGRCVSHLPQHSASAAAQRSQRARVAPQEVEREAAAVMRLWNSVFTPLPEATVAHCKHQHADRHCSDHAARGQRDHSRGESCDQLRIGVRQIECALCHEQFGRDERNQSAHGCIAQPMLHSFRQRK